MINEVMNEIVYAEKEAEALLMSAQNSAMEISLQTGAQIDKLTKTYAQKTKEQLEAIQKKAADDSARQAKKIFEDSKAEAEKISKQAERNVSAAVQLVTDFITKGRI